ncbi:MAG: UDP-N-acetylmuramoyl-L-alanyl-D-glutamate--2,6-diaminopimelate ligase [Hyphomicrobiaceae bacterium]|nr:UDP-N-acetylmuramoyl-L-alanyl-D-glutamate--2,6-diaminopimelate ligase [Hyphomicrobiaceae bacterium]
MLLSQLLGPEIKTPAGASQLFITGMTADSRTAAPGFVFAALPGARADGAKFIADAVARGAVAVVAADDVVVPDWLTVPLLRVANPRRELALMAARFYPAQPETAVAVTGTSGKTSVAEFTRQIFKAAGKRAASVGTIGIVRPDGSVYGSLTTPDPISLHATLAELAAEGITHLAFEASSHGLDQCRLDGVRLDAAAFTNLGRDHLDYHPTVENYFAAKMRLFEELLRPGQPAVVNVDGAMSERVVDVARARGLDVMTVGSMGGLLRREGVRLDGFGQIVTVRHKGGVRDVRLPLIGAYQVENALTAAGLAIAAGIDAETALSALESLDGVRGRLDIVGEVKGGLVVVDYAHKPEALAAALAGVRPFVTGKLVCVFGCGGDRDRGKREIMGRIAVEGADHVIVTDDNPRSENPAAIRAEILKGATGAAEIGDRRAAIDAAVASAGAGDVVIIAGKGHETGQIVGGEVLPFSDHLEARAAIERAGDAAHD